MTFSLSTALTEWSPPKLMTEREARLAGQVSNRLCITRGMLMEGITTGTLTVSTKGSGGTHNQNLTIPSEELEALVALLIERDEAFLVGLNIELEK